MRRTLILLLSAATISIEALKQRPIQLDFVDGCATVDCASGLVCGLAIPQSCNVAPCPKMPTCLPKNQTCDAKSCKADETCVLRSVTCIKAPCYPVRECAKFPKCGDNEEYNECSLNGPCEANCTDSFPICANVTCGKGACECKPGFFRHNGKCITKDKCPTPKCEMPNEVWNTCPSACTQTCRIFRGKDEQMPCPAVCDIPQCTCAVGYVRDDDWNCVKQEDCPKEFKCSSPHEEYTDCSSHCEPTCDNRMPSCIDSCGPAKCQCKPNYVRHEGSCLFALQCPQEGNSTMGPIPDDDDVSGSEENSEGNSDEIVSSPSCETIRCGANSACSIQGGKPICSKCGKNEKLDLCPNPCSESTCEEGNEKKMCMAVKMCRGQKCICDDGFVRNTKNGKCVKQSQCPAVDTSTVHIMPVFPNWTKPLIRPAFPDNNGTNDGKMHILPFPAHDGAVHIMPAVENGSMFIDPIPSNRTRPMIKPFFPTNGTAHINPHFGNGTIQISPPYVGPLVRPAFPDRTNATALVDPIPSNWTRPMTRPFFPDNNGSFVGSAHILPFIPRDHGEVHASASENGTMNTMPHVGKDGLLTDPIPSNWTKPMTRPFFPVNNGSFDGSAHILPFIPNEGAVHIMPIFENGTALVDPIFNNRTRPQVRPFYPDNGTVHIMPHRNDNGTVISVPYVPSFNGSASILPFFPGNASVHVRPIFTNQTRPQVMPLKPGKENGTMHTLPFIPGAVHIMPVAENETMHILPHILPYPENTSSSSVCANHTCPAGSSCEETPVMCFAAPCPPIPTCVSVTPRGGGARDDPIICGKNEEHSECAPPCEETCRGVSDCANKVMAAVCKPGCVCKDKFKRDGNGVCVPNHKCWKTAGCQDNEIWHKCHTCEPTCTDAKENCTADCISGCGCEDGLVRGPMGDCIVQSKCPKFASNSTKA